VSVELSKTASADLWTRVGSQTVDWNLLRAPHDAAGPSEPMSFTVGLASSEGSETVRPSAFSAAFVSG
jgi:hypothetical protein